MSYEFTKLSNVPAVSEFPEGANAIIETNGEIKRCPSAGGNSVPKPLTYDYMPEGYPKKTMETVTVMEEQELAFAAAGSLYFAAPLSLLDIVGGQTYTVKWDGTEHECVCSIFNGTVLALGNLSIIGMGSNTGEPFCYTSAEESFITNDTSASHTISVKTAVETVTPMADEFLPAIPIFYAAITGAAEGTDIQLTDAAGKAIAYEQARAAGINVIIQDSASENQLTQFRPTRMKIGNATILYWIVDENNVTRRLYAGKLK